MEGGEHTARRDRRAVAPAQEAGELKLDRTSRKAYVKHKEVPLSAKEFDLLWALAEHRGTVVRSAQLLLQVWGYDSRIRTRTLDVHIGRLRAKIETDTRHPRYIVTVPGVGYKLCAPEPAANAA